MLAKEIGENLNNGIWTEVRNKATLYTNPSLRIKLVVEEYRPSNGGIFISEDVDQEASDKNFTNTFMNSFGMELCPAQEILLIQALAESLKDWSKDSPQNKEMVNQVLKNLIN